MRRRGKHRTEVHADIDRHVGARLQMGRTLLGMNQSQLGAAFGITFQQVQKYENGANRVSASRLYQFAGILGVSVSFFFDGLEFKRHGGRRATRQDDEPLHKRETWELMRAFARISNSTVRKSLTSLIVAVAARSDKPGLHASC